MGEVHYHLKTRVFALTLAGHVTGESTAHPVIRDAGVHGGAVRFFSLSASI